MFRKTDKPEFVVISEQSHRTPLLFGDGKDATFANTASVGYLWSDEDNAISGSEGYYVEVYEDYVLLKGCEYTGGDWCAAAQFNMPLSEKDAHLRGIISQ